MSATTSCASVRWASPAHAVKSQPLGASRTRVKMVAAASRLARVIVAIVRPDGVESTAGRIAMNASKTPARTVSVLLVFGNAPSFCIIAS